MRFHFKAACTVVVLLAVLVTPSFSGLRDKGLKVQTVELPGLEVSSRVVLVQQRYALVIPDKPTKLADDEEITLANRDLLDNNQLFIFDSQNIGAPRTISLGGCYFSQLSYYQDGLVVCEGTDFVEKAGENGPEIQALDVIVYFWLSLDDEKPNAGSRPVRIEIPAREDSAVRRGASSFARVSDNQLAFMNDTGDLSVYNTDDGSLASFPSDNSGSGTLSIIGAHQGKGVLAVANQVTVSSDDGSETHKTELSFLRVEKSGSISLVRAFSPQRDDPFVLVDGSNIVFLDAPDGTPFAAYGIDSMGNLREFALSEDGVGSGKKIVQFPGLAQDPSQPYATLCPRNLQLDLDGLNILADRPGRVATIRRPAFGRPSGSGGIRRPAFITSEERVGVCLGRLLKSKHGGLLSERGDIGIMDLSAAIGDDVSALVPTAVNTWLTLLKDGSVYVLAFSNEEHAARMVYQGSLGKGPVVAGAYDAGQLAAIRASAAGESTESATSDPALGALMMAKMKGGNSDLSGSSVAFSVAQGGGQLASPPSKSVAPSIRRPCNVGR